MYLLYLILLYFTIKIALEDYFYFGIRLFTFYIFILLLTFFIYVKLGLNIYVFYGILFLLFVSILLDIISFLILKKKKVAVDLSILPISDIIFIILFFLETLLINIKIIIPGYFNLYLFLFILLSLLILTIYLSKKYYLFITNKLNIKDQNELTISILNFFEKEKINKLELFKNALKYKEKLKKPIYIAVYFVLGIIQIFYFYLIFIYV